MRIYVDPFDPGPVYVNSGMCRDYGGMFFQFSCTRLFISDDSSLVDVSWIHRLVGMI